MQQDQMKNNEYIYDSIVKFCQEAKYDYPELLYIFVSTVNNKFVLPSNIMTYITDMILEFTQYDLSYFNAKSIRYILLLNHLKNSQMNFCKLFEIFKHKSHSLRDNQRLNRRQFRGISNLN